MKLIVLFVNIEGSEKPYKIETIIIHERNGEDDAGYDIALIKLSSDLQYSAAVRPVCLPKNPLPDFASCVAIGWGETHGTWSE